MLACNPRSNHVHVVVAAPRIEPETIMEEFKSWSTRRLKAVGLGRAGMWTREGSTRYLFWQDAVDAAVKYVLVEQDRLERFVLPVRKEDS
jgi:REP element-mobilizing transposase RayT